MEIAATFRAAKLLLSARVKTVPALFLPIARLRENAKRTAIRPNTDILITGYWRCANHYATSAFISSQNREMRVARHFHAPAQLMLAVRWNIPAVLLIRNPIDAVASATVFLQNDDPLPLLKFYNVYYGTVLPYRDRVVVSDFDRTTNDFGSVIAEVNRRYGRDFTLYEKTPENEERVASLIREEHRVNMRGDAATLPLPSHDKDRIKNDISQRLLEARYTDVLKQAQQYYSILSARNPG